MGACSGCGAEKKQGQPTPQPLICSPEQAFSRAKMAFYLKATLPHGLETPLFIKADSYLFLDDK